MPLGREKNQQSVRVVPTGSGKPTNRTTAIDADHTVQIRGVYRAKEDVVHTVHFANSVYSI